MHLPSNTDLLLPHYPMSSMKTASRSVLWIIFGISPRWCHSEYLLTTLKNRCMRLVLTLALPLQFCYPSQEYLSVPLGSDYSVHDSEPVSSTSFDSLKLGFSHLRNFQKNLRFCFWVQRWSIHLHCACPRICLGKMESYAVNIQHIYLPPCMGKWGQRHIHLYWPHICSFVLVND